MPDIKRYDMTTDGLGGWCIAEEEDGNYVSLTDHISALEAVKATVRPLEWREGRDDQSVFSVVQRATILGADELVGLEYTILGPDRHGLFEVILGDKIIRSADSEANAKAAAQADYEQRILSAIVPSPALEANQQTPSDGAIYKSVSRRAFTDEENAALDRDVAERVRIARLEDGLEANQQVIETLRAALEQIINEDDTGPMTYETRPAGPPQALGGSKGRFTAIARAALTLTTQDEEAGK